MKLILLVFLGAGCGGSLPDRLSGCPDLACQQRWVADRWERDQEAVIAAVREIPDPVTRIALVRQLTLAHPGEATPLCELLDSRQEQESCRERNRRPHLQDVKIKPQTEGADVEDDDAHGLQLTRPIPSPWAEVPPEALDCAVEPRVCQTDEARRRGEQGDLRGAAAACSALETPEWRAECFFQAAEVAGRVPGAPGGEALSLCLGASSYAGRCLSHLVRQYGTQAPRAAGGDKARWDSLTASITAATQQLAADPELASAFENQAWAYSLRFSYNNESSVNGSPLDFVPEVAAPHVRAALAARAFAREANQRRSLADWQARLGELIADRAPKAPASALTQPRGPSRVLDYWATLLPGEERIPRVPYLGPTPRPVSEDPDLDLLLCLLEAAARGRPPGVPLLEEALNHEDPLVRWSAVRLLKSADPGNRTLQRHRDADPLVQARVPSGLRKAPGR